MKTAIAFAVLFFGLQVAFWYKTHEVLPDMSIVPDVPGQETVKALSLGDEHFFFRLLALQIQNSGDTFGRFTALYKYDFNKLYHWFRLLDSLDTKSNYVPAMATYYFSQTQHRPDVKYIVDYLIEHASVRVEEKWWWLVQGIYLANHKLEDSDLALRIAQHLSGDYDIPVWAKQMPAFVHEKRGEMDAALAIIEQIVESEDELEQKEINFMYYFLKDRLGKLGELESKLDAHQKTLDQKQDAIAETNEE